MCETCQEMKPQTLLEPLKQRSDGDEPWQKIGLDFFEIAEKHYRRLLLQLYRERLI